MVLLRRSPWHPLPAHPVRTAQEEPARKQEAGRPRHLAASPPSGLPASSPQKAASAAHELCRLHALTQGSLTFQIPTSSATPVSMTAVPPSPICSAPREHVSRPPRCSPEDSPWVVRVIGLGAGEDDEERGGSGEEQVCALGDDADGSPGSHLHRHAVAAVHHAAFHPDLERGNEGASPRRQGRRRAGARRPLTLQGDWGTQWAPSEEHATLDLKVVSSSPTLGLAMTSK